MTEHDITELRDAEIKELVTIALQRRPEATATSVANGVMAALVDDARHAIRKSAKYAITEELVGDTNRATRAQWAQLRLAITEAAHAAKGRGAGAHGV